MIRTIASSGLVSALGSHAALVNLTGAAASAAPLFALTATRRRR